MGLVTPLHTAASHRSPSSCGVTRDVTRVCSRAGDHSSHQRLQHDAHAALVDCARNLTRATHSIRCCGVGTRRGDDGASAAADLGIEDRSSRHKSGGAVLEINARHSSRFLVAIEQQVRVIPLSEQCRTRTHRAAN